MAQASALYAWGSTLWAIFFFSSWRLSHVFNFQFSCVKLWHQLQILKSSFCSNKGHTHCFWLCSSESGNQQCVLCSTILSNIRWKSILWSKPLRRRPGWAEPLVQWYPATYREVKNSGWRERPAWIGILFSPFTRCVLLSLCFLCFRLIFKREKLFLADRNFIKIGFCLTYWKHSLGVISVAMWSPIITPHARCWVASRVLYSLQNTCINKNNASWR